MNSSSSSSSRIEIDVFEYSSIVGEGGGEAVMVLVRLVTGVVVMVVEVMAGLGWLVPDFVVESWGCAGDFGDQGGHGHFDVQFHHLDEREVC